MHFDPSSIFTMKELEFMMPQEDVEKTVRQIIMKLIRYFLFFIKSIDTALFTMMKR